MSRRFGCAPVSGGEFRSLPLRMRMSLTVTIFIVRRYPSRQRAREAPSEPGKPNLDLAVSARPQVDTEHLLLGLMEEHASTSSKPGFMGTKLTVSDARDVARSLFGRSVQVPNQAKDLQFR